MWLQSPALSHALEGERRGKTSLLLTRPFPLPPFPLLESCCRGMEGEEPGKGEGARGALGGQVAQVRAVRNPDAQAMREACDAFMMKGQADLL